MAAESNSGFLGDETFGSTLNGRAISFQSGAINSSSGMIPMGGFYGVNNMAGPIYSGNSCIANNNNPMINQIGNPSVSSYLFDTVPGLKHDTGLVVEWSVEEQYRLEEGLVKYDDEPCILKYIKLAAMLPEKTVRDVALRCRWMMRKRRKPDEHIMGKKVNGRKDKLVESSSKVKLCPTLPSRGSTYTPNTHHRSQKEYIACEVSGISGTSKQLLEQNAQAFSQIAANLSAYKLQDNINLFSRARKNISTILNDMSGMRNIMSHMPPLPVSLDEDLANSIWLNKT